MIISDHNVQIAGHLLHRTIFDPSEEYGPPKRACLFSHGQGDFSKRYAEVLHPFTERGIRCIAIDLLGHGMSPGKRGHAGNLELIDTIIQSNLSLTEGLDYGIAGHSMGGLLTLRHLTLALENKLPMPKFCWVNSPLLQPAHGKADWFIKIARFLAKRTPKLTIKTGATPELCQTTMIGAKKNSYPSEPKKQLGHQKISLGWGVELITISEYITQNLPNSNADIPFLLTQGDTDFICPHSIADTFFEQLKLPNKTYHLFKDMRHETFAEPNKDELFSAVSKWLEENSLN